MLLGDIVPSVAIIKENFRWWFDGYETVTKIFGNHNFAVAIIKFKRGTYLSIVKNILTRYCTVDWYIENASVRNFN